MEFGLRVATHSILKEINNGCQEKNNLVISPLSLHISLNILASASSGSTTEQLFRFLGCKDTTEFKAQSSRFMQIVTGCKDLYDSDSDEDEILRGDAPIVVLNGIWLDRRFSLKHSFKQLAENDFKANARTVDFQNQAAEVTEEINSWAREASKGCINWLVPPTLFKKYQAFVLASSIYFNGLWLKKFYGTRDEDFHLLTGETIKVPFMKREDATYSCGSFEGFSLVRLPYDQGQYKNRYSMFIFLPDQKDGLPELVQKFHSDPGFLLEDRELEEVVFEKVWLPKLKYGYDLNVSETMIELGLDLPFAEGADFTKMVEDSNEKIYVSSAIQKCYIDVNEDGTIATALTAMPGIGAFYPEPAPTSFVADHPFMFIIKEEHSGIWVFVGAALNPLSS